MAKYEWGSGNVFADIGLPNPELALAKAEIVARITGVLDRRKISQSKAAEILGISQPDVSNLLRGRGRFSLEKLIGFATALGIDVELQLKLRTRGRAHLKVSEAAA